VVRARSGEDTLKAMLRQDFTVVLLDVVMPGMDGFEAAASIKRLDQTKDAPVILLTGHDAPADYAYRDTPSAPPISWSSPSTRGCYAPRSTSSRTWTARTAILPRGPGR